SDIDPASCRRGDRIRHFLLHCICRLLAQTRPTDISALTTAFGCKSGPDMLTSSSSVRDPFDTSKLYASAPTLGRRPLSQHQRAVLICGELPLKQDGIRIADPHAASRTGSSQCSEEETNEPA